VRIVALQTVGRREGLIVMRLLQALVFRVMTIQAQSRRALRQVKLVFYAEISTGFVADVTSVAPHVERGVPATFFVSIRSLVMAGEAQVLFFVARGGLQKLVLVVGRVGIVTDEAVTHGWLMNMPFDLGCILVRVAGQTESVWDSGDQLDASYVFGDPNFVAAQASRLDR